MAKQRVRGHAMENFRTASSATPRASSSLKRTQLRLASPARSHARTNETNAICRLDSQSQHPICEYIYIYIYVYIYFYIYIYIYISISAEAIASGRVEVN